MAKIYFIPFFSLSLYVFQPLSNMRTHIPTVSTNKTLFKVSASCDSVVIDVTRVEMIY